MSPHARRFTVPTIQYWIRAIVSKPLLSVVTVTLNSEKYIESCIKSVINQCYPNIEIVIIDGGSSDRTIELLGFYREKIKYIISEPDDGIYDAINKGISMCSGEVIKILNSDDLLLPGAASMAMELYEKHGKGRAVIFIGRSRVIDTHGRTVGQINQRHVIYRFPSFNHPGWFASSSVYSLFGLYSKSYRISSDYEFFVRYTKGGGTIFWDDAEWVSYRQNGASSGWLGVKEVFTINKIHFGLLTAWIVGIQHLAGKIARNFYKKLKK